MDPVEEYARDVLAGRVVAGRLVRLACERHLRDLEEGPKRGLRWDWKRARMAVNFVQLMPQRKGQWQHQPIVLQPWQVFRIGSVFGWLRADGRRRYRTAYNEVGRGNGKTTEAAGIGNLMFTFDDEPGAEVYAVATKREQARVCWDEAKWQMEDDGPGHDEQALSSQLGVVVLAHNMHHPASASKFQALGADRNSGDAINPHCYIYDELHAWVDREYRDKLDTALVKRRQPLKWQITTTGTASSTLWMEEREYAIKVLERVVEDDTYFAYIAKVDDEAHWEDEREWAKANPNLGVTVELETLQAVFAKAKEKPSELANAKRMHLGIVAQADNPWVHLPLWDAQEARRPMEELAGKECFAGLDLSSTTDLTALGLWFPDGDDAGDYLVEFWMPQGSVEERVRRDRVPYDVWIEQGLIHVIPGPAVDYNYLFRRACELADQYQVKTWATDPWSARQLSLQLEGEGFTVVQVPQRMERLAGPTKEIGRLLALKGLRHGGNPVLRWMASHVIVWQDAAGNIRLDKAKSPERIDGLAALVNAVSEAILAKGETPEGFSVYVGDDE